MLLSPVLFYFRSISFYYSIGDVLEDISISAKKKNHYNMSKLSVKVTCLFGVLEELNVSYMLSDSRSYHHFVGQVGQVA